MIAIGVGWMWCYRVGCPYYGEPRRVRSVLGGCVMCGGELHFCPEAELGQQLQMEV